MKMETYTTAPDLSDPENVLYTVKSDVTGNDEVGVNFMELWSYYHLYKELNYGGGLSYTTGGSVPSNAPYLQTKNTQEELNTDPWDRLFESHHYYFPITLERENNSPALVENPGY